MSSTFPRLTRREVLTRLGGGFGGMALAALLGEAPLSAHEARPALYDTRPRPPHHRLAKADGRERGRAYPAVSAVVGSITERTSETLFAGKPPCSACWRIMSSFGAM